MTAKKTQPDQLGHEATMSRIKAGMDRLGDLPIFSTSINKVRRVSSDPQADAMAVAQEVMKDANLCTKLLRLANSAYNNRGVGKISVVSRAVIMLGFETVRNLTLTLKLIESFQTANTATHMSRMLVRSYIAAGMVRELAAKCGVKDIEESYVCALLNNLGEIIVAYVLPQDYARIQELQNQVKPGQRSAEQEVLGTGFDAISQELAQSWEFPNSVVGSMSRSPMKMNAPLHDRLQLNRALAWLANDLVGSMYVAKQDTAECFSDALRNLAGVTGLNPGLIENSFSDSFRMSCALAHDYGLDIKLLKPLLGDGEDTARDKWARQFSFYATADKDGSTPSNSTSLSSRRNEAGASTRNDFSPERMHTPPIMSADGSAMAPDATTRTAAPAAIHNAQLQLSLIQEITAAITQGARLNQIFVKVLEGIQKGAGFERVILCLVSPDRRSYIARLAVGAEREQLKAFFALPINPKRELFSRVLLEGSELMINDMAKDDVASQLPDGFAKIAAVSGFAIASLNFESKPVGFFYADRPVSGVGIDADDLRNMLNFVAQARLAMRICN